MTRTTRRTTIALLLAAAAIPAAAQDEGLYDPAPPADAAYLRVINLAAMDGSLTVGPVSFGASAEPAITPYQIASAGTYPVDGTDADLTLDAGKSYTLVLGTDGTPTLIEDKLVENPAKSGLMLYNLTDGATGRLYVPGRDVDVVADLPPGGHDTREVNAITVDLAVSADGSELATFPETKLDRRAHISFVLYDAGDGPATLMALNSAEKG